LTTEHFTFQVLFLKSLVCKNTFEKRLWQHRRGCGYCTLCWCLTRR
jgi:hypothetical protein